MIAIYCGVGATIYFFYQKMLVAPEAEEAERKAKKEAKKANKKK